MHVIFHFLKFDLVTCTYCWWLSMECFFNILGAIIGVTFWQLYKQRYSGSSPGLCSKLEKEHERWWRHHDWGIQRKLNFLHTLQGLCPIHSETGIFAASPCMAFIVKLHSCMLSLSIPFGQTVVQINHKCERFLYSHKNWKGFVLL